LITPLPPSRQITTPHSPIDTTAATKEKISHPDRCMRLINSVLHTTSYTTSLIRVTRLNEVVLREVTVKIRRSSMNKTDSIISEI
jgi:hypothetical protein